MVLRFPSSPSPLLTCVFTMLYAIKKWIKRISRSIRRVHLISGLSTVLYGGRGIDCKVLSPIIQTSVNFATSFFFEWKYMKRLFELRIKI